MQVEIERTRELRFDDGTPVTSASALAPFGDGWLVAQDDATHAALLVDGPARRLRLLPPVEGLDVFSEAAGTAHLRPDLEAACTLVVDGRPGVLLLGSGSTPLRRRGVLVLDAADEPQVDSGSLDGLYDAVAASLGVPPEQLDIEGVARNGGVVRWFSRGNPAAGVPSGSVDVGLGPLLEALIGTRDPAEVPLRAPRTYDLGEVDGVGLAANDAVALPGGRVLLSAAAEDGRADPAAVAAALVLLDDERVLDRVVLPRVSGGVHRVEGLGVLELLDDGARLLAVVDAAPAPSVELVLRVRWQH